MRFITLKLVLALFLVIAGVFTLSSFWQTYVEKNRILIELERRSYTQAGVFQKRIDRLVQKNDPQELRAILDEYAAEESLFGISIHDAEGKLLAASGSVEGLIEASPKAIAPRVLDAAKLNLADGNLLRLNGVLLHAYTIPVSKKGEVQYGLTLYHTVHFIKQRIHQIWANNFFRFLVLTFLISVTTLAIFYLNVLAPIQKTAEWIKKVRLGEVSAGKLDPRGAELLGPVAKEISQMAKSLVRAREAAEEEARLRHSSESVWTPERLKELVRGKLDGKALFVVSNREPYMHVRKGKEIEWVVPASGLVTAIEPVLKACGGTWIAQGSGEADQETVDKNDRLRVPPEEPQYTLRRVWLTKEEEDGYYYGFANEGLWPLCHIAHTRPIFREGDWLAYESANRKFADAVVEELEGETQPCVLIQDYHFALLPRLIKERRPDARVAIFWHIPWPNPESFGICPWQTELLRGMLGADIIGFHTQYHCNNFLQTVDRFLESRIDYEHFSVSREGHVTSVKPFPISIAFLGEPSGHPPARLAGREELLKPYGVSGSTLLGVGVDRVDYTKGILERFRAVELFLERNPDYQGRFTFVELGAPSRSKIPKYQDFMLEVEREAERINARFKAKNWKAILFLKKHHSQKEILPFYEAADLCMVTSLHDGMNLVAKEFVTARHDGKGVLILSQFTGAARELKDALIINPYDIGQAAEAIRVALMMPPTEQADRMKRMRAVLKDRNIYRWAADLVTELSQVRFANSLKPLPEAAHT